MVSWYTFYFYQALSSVVFRRKARFHIRFGFVSFGTTCILLMAVSATDAIAVCKPVPFVTDPVSTAWRSEACLVPVIIHGVFSPAAAFSPSSVMKNNTHLKLQRSAASYFSRGTVAVVKLRALMSETVNSRPCYTVISSSCRLPASQ